MSLLPGLIGVQGTRPPSSLRHVQKNGKQDRHTRADDAADAVFMSAKNKEVASSRPRALRRWFQVPRKVRSVSGPDFNPTFGVQIISCSCKPTPVQQRGAMMKPFALGLVVVLFISGCDGMAPIKSPSPSTPTVPTPVLPSKLPAVVFLGDSITYNWANHGQVRPSQRIPTGTTRV